jgi:prepilin signal peptidase PulO-like enzyme (type II secretory pathway)
LPPEALIPILLGFLGMIVFYLATFGLLFLGLAVWGAYIGYGLYGAVANLQGKDFRYVIIGPRLERYLKGTPASTTPAP